MFNKLLSFDNIFGQELFPNASTFKKGEEQDQREVNIEIKETSNGGRTVTL